MPEGICLKHPISLENSNIQWLSKMLIHQNPPDVLIVQISEIQECWYFDDDHDDDHPKISFNCVGDNINHYFVLIRTLSESSHPVSKPSWRRPHLSGQKYFIIVYIATHPYLLSTYIIHIVGECSEVSFVHMLYVYYRQRRHLCHCLTTVEIICSWSSDLLVNPAGALRCSMSALWQS